MASPNSGPKRPTTAECEPIFPPALTSGDAQILAHPFFEIVDIEINGIKQKIWKNVSPLLDIR